RHGDPRPRHRCMLGRARAPQRIRYTRLGRQRAGPARRRGAAHGPRPAVELPMKVAVNPPKTPLTKGSTGVSAATVPNVCKMPGPPAPFVPTPLPNIAKTGDSPSGYTKKVKIEGKTVA